MTEKIVNIGYIGNGKSANRYHMPFALARPEKFRITTVFAPVIEHDTWAEVPGITYTTRLEDVLGDPSIDVVEVCTPSALHYEHVRLVLEAGKHAVVDKPFSPSEAQAAELFELARAHNVTVQCYQNRRFDSDYLTARQVYESGCLGKVFEVVTSYDYFRPEMLAGQPLDVVNNAAYGHASHCLDQLIAWFGEPAHVHSELRQLQGTGYANDYFDFDLYYDLPDGRELKATARANYASAFQRPSFELYGDRGAYIKLEKDSQERDLKHFYLPRGHGDFGLDSLEQYGTLRFLDEDDILQEKRVPSVRSSYAQFYDALYETVTGNAPQLVAPEQTLTQMRILERAAKRLS